MSEQDPVVEVLNIVKRKPKVKFRELRGLLTAAGVRVESDLALDRILQQLRKAGSIRFENGWTVASPTPASETVSKATARARAVP